MVFEEGNMLLLLFSGEISRKERGLKVRWFEEGDVLWVRDLYYEGEMWVYGF